jgi:hypothetical protein
MTSYFQYTPSTYTPSMPSPSGRLDTTFSGGVGSVDYGRIPAKPMGEWPISTCKMTGGKRRKTGRKHRGNSKKTKRSRKHNKSRKASRR